MKRFPQLLTFALGITSGVAIADRPAPNRAYTQYSANRNCRMDNTPKAQFGNDGISKVYRQRKNSEWEYLYSFKFFSPGVDILNGCEIVIRRGAWGGDDKNFSDEALSFFRRGQFLKSYLVSDLLVDRSKIVRTSSHYLWQKTYELVESQRFLKVVVMDESTYFFNTTTGLIDPKHPGR